MLRHLHDIGLPDELAFKGGTALRKLYAGAQGRFSLDLDFSVRDLDGDATATLEVLVEAVRDLEPNLVRRLAVLKCGSPFGMAAEGAARGPATHRHPESVPRCPLRSCGATRVGLNRGRAGRSCPIPHRGS